MNTPIAEELRQQAEALAATIKNSLGGDPYGNATEWNQETITTLIATALQYAVCEALREDKDLTLAYMVGYSEGKGMPTHTPRNAQQSEANNVMKDGEEHA